MEVHKGGGTNWRKDGVLDLSVALGGSTKLKGPCRKWAASLSGIFSAHAMYLEARGIVVGLNSTRSRYSMMPSVDVR